MGILHILWLGNILDFADITWQKPNINQVQIN